jgi:micrococcal nuclease
MNNFIRINKKNTKEKIILIFLIFLLLIINYKFLDEKLTGFFIESKTGVVQRIVDGDTIIINNQSTRLLGINTPEKNEKYYQEAKEFLNKTLLNKTVKVEYGRGKYDKYKRELAFIFLESRNINIEMVKRGFANVYILNEKRYEKELRDAWQECIEENKNLCEKSKDRCAKCIELKNLSVKSQTVIFYNKCDFSCNLTGWTIKDEGRKKFVFPYFILEKNKSLSVVVRNKNISEIENKEYENKNDNYTLYWNNESYVWTSTGDTLFLRDLNNNLVLWKIV